LDELADRGYVLTLPEDLLNRVAGCGLVKKNIPLAVVATQIAREQQPLTLRGLFYQVVSAGWLPSTDRKHYDRLGRVMIRLRETGVVPFRWLVDNVRRNIKPSSWSGLDDFADTVKHAYRKDFWSRLPTYVHIFVEKDAITGVVEPVTREFNVTLSPIRGYVSLSFANEIATTWSRIRKPIYAYYLGDFDPSGFDLERDVREKLARYCKRPFDWTRLAVDKHDFDDFDLIPLTPKQSDRRCAAFIREHGERCAEVDALPANELRERIRLAIEPHIPRDEWERLTRTEELERESFARVLDAGGVQ